MANDSSTGGYLNAEQPYPLDDDPFDNVVEAFVSALSGLDSTLVRPRWQPIVPLQPPPTTNWIAIGDTDDTPDQGPVFTWDQSALQGQYDRHEDMNYLASFYGPQSKTIAALVRDGGAIPQNLEALIAIGAQLIETGTIRKAPELVNEQWIIRHDMTMHFRRHVQRFYDVTYLLSSIIRLKDDTKIDETFIVSADTPPRD